MRTLISIQERQTLITLKPFLWDHVQCTQNPKDHAMRTLNSVQECQTQSTQACFVEFHEVETKPKRIMQCKPSTQCPQAFFVGSCSMQNKNQKDHCNANPKLNARAANPKLNPLRPCLLREERESSQRLHLSRCSSNLAFSWIIFSLRCTHPLGLCAWCVLFLFCSS